MNTLKTTSLNAVFTALVAIATLLIRVPVPATQGYINLGDAVVIAAALLMGPRTGLIAGGIGSALADWMGGYAHWAPFTLIIKGLEGYLVGLVGTRSWGSRGSRTILAATIGGVTVVGGYFLVEVSLYGREAALVAASANAFQMLCGAIAGVAAAAALRRLIGLPTSST
jgi:uncharacterized membrane protein